MTLYNIIAQVRTETEEAATPAPANGAFSKLNPKLQLFWDSTSYGALETCPRLYELTMIENRIPRGTVKVDLVFGQLYQRAREFYDRFRLTGHAHDEALREVVRDALIQTWDPVLKRPWVSNDPTKNRETLIRAIVWYHDQFAADDFETLVRQDGTPAVELSFRFPTGVESTEGEEFWLCGHLDRVAQSRTTKRKAIIDHKTTRGQIGENYFLKYSPDTQVSIYDIAGEVTMHEPIPDFFIDVAQLGVTFARFQRGKIHRTPALREEWLENFAIRMEEVQRYAESGRFPQNPKACNAYSSYSEDFDDWKHGGCPFREVCGSDPSVRPAILKGNTKPASGTQRNQDRRNPL